MLQNDIVVSNNQFINFGRLLVAGRPGSEVFERDGIATYWSGDPAMFYNLILLSERITGRVMLNERLGAAAHYMRAKAEPGLFLISDDYLDGEAHTEFDLAIKEADLVSVMETIGMVGDLAAFEESLEHPDLRFERVTDDSGFDECADINSAAYGLPIELMRGGLSKATLWKERVFCFLAYHGDKAVSTASVAESDGMLYVAYVATHPDAQRRGFAEATMRHALKVASEATGCRQTYLHSTKAGYAVYERMGYTSVTRIVGFAPAIKEACGHP